MGPPWALAVLLAVDLAPRRHGWERLPREEELPRAYTWIRNEPSVKALVELPLFGDSRENLYLYNSTVHWKPIANGYSGYFAETYTDLTNHIPYVPHRDGLDMLRGMGITHIVVHADIPRQVKMRDRWEERLGTGPEREVEKVYAEPGISIYRILPEAVEKK